MMLSPHKKIGIAVLFAAIIIAGGLIFWSPKNKDFSGDSNDNVSDSAKGFQLNEGSGKLVTNSVGDLNILDLSASVVNLTQKLADDLAQGFIVANPTGADKTTGDLKVPDGESILGTISDKYSEEFNLSEKFVDLDDLKISKDNSKENIRDYYGQYFQFINESAEKMKVSDRLEAFADNPDSSFITPLIGYFDELIVNLEKLEVPSDFAQLHRTEINLLISEREIFSALVNADEDPFRAVIALNMWPDVQENFNALSNAIADALRDKGFNITQ